MRVYISVFAPFVLGLTAYHIDSMIRVTSTKIDDGFHRVFINAKVDDGTEIARLMRCFRQEEVDDPKFPKISERVHMLKHSEGGVKVMCAIMEEYARHFFQNGVSLEIVKASIPNLSEKELLEIYHAVQE